MNSQSISWSPFLHLLFTISFLILAQAPNRSSSPDEYYHTCANTFSCGNITGIGYPFRGHDDPRYCGYPSLILTCDDQKNTTNIDILSTKYRVLDIDETTQTMRIAREDVMDGHNCPVEMVNTTLDYSIFDYAGAYMNYTYLFGCPGTHYLGLSSISCGNDNGVYFVPGDYGPRDCNASIIVPGPATGDGGGGPLNGTQLGEVLPEGFLVRWKIGGKACSDCLASEGRCGYDLAANQTACFCPDPPYISDTCPPTANGTTPAKESSPGTSPVVRSNDHSNTGGTIAEASKDHSNNGRNMAFYAVGALLGGVGLGWLIFSLRQRRKRRRLASKSAQIIPKDVPPHHHPSTRALSSPPSKNLTRSMPSSYATSNSDFGRGSSYFGVQVFDYSELEDATNNFATSRELGDGGFGTVYYGVLHDGLLVAVKRLYEHNFRRVEQFMNELEILTRLRHQNLVALYGCTSRRSRELLLVYEYIPNGTVADHLHGRRAKSGLLSWPIRLNIAVETADALAYLHKSDTIHRDVKTNNILLDNDFHVKVADFGLSRLFPSDVTHVSTAPQGTPGYVDPEYYQCYQLTEKSDVYSFGVVLIELISSLKAVDTDRHRHDINLSNMAINKIRNHTLHELVDPSLGFETNSTVRRMITLIAELAFQCLQQENDMRPSMGQVLETLRGIQNQDLNAHRVEIVDMVMDEEAAMLKTPPSPDPCAMD